MAYQHTTVGRFIATGKDAEAFAAIVDAVSQCAGNSTHAAALVGVDLTTFNRWIVRLDKLGHPIREKLEEARRDGVALSRGTVAQMRERGVHERQVAAAKRRVSAGGAVAVAAVARLARCAGSAVDTWAAGGKESAAIEAAALRWVATAAEK